MGAASAINALRYALRATQRPNPATPPDEDRGAAVTTPAQDAPLVFPSVAFRPVRLFVTSLVLTVAAIAAAGWLGQPMVGVFFGVGPPAGFAQRAQRTAFGGVDHRGGPSTEEEDGVELRDPAIVRDRCRTDGRIRFPARRAGRGIRACAVPGACWCCRPRCRFIRSCVIGAVEATEGTGNGHD